MNVDECCAVCAEPLEWVAIGECGHRETCTECVARWRFVLKDDRCMMCKQQQPRVLFTRFMGDFTPRPTAAQFVDLAARATRGELYSLPQVGGFFDDRQHYQLIKSLCGLVHPVVVEKCQEAGLELPDFKSMGHLKKFVREQFNLHFCDICLASRKVFVCEQQLYTRAELDRHMTRGDDSGALAETSFKGHPLCQFCNKRFYDANEQWRHMETAHEHCFLCRRVNPGRYVYYRHYAELEEHFQADHHPCPHPSCLEKKFVVFPSEVELKRHVAMEHGDELKLSKAARREALTIPVDLQFRDGPPGRGSGGGGGGGGGAASSSSSAAPAAPNLMDRPGVIIGGGYNVGYRHGARGGPPGMHHSRSAGDVQVAIAASLQDQDAARHRAEGRGGPRRRDAGGSVAQNDAASPVVSSVVFSAADFPSVSGSTAGLPMTGRWGGAIPGSAGPGGGGLSEEQFPALPSLSKAARRRLREQQASLADQLRAANMPVRVISRANGVGPSAPSPRPSGQGAGGAPSATNPGPGSVSSSGRTSPAPASTLLRQSTSATALGPHAAAVPDNVTSRLQGLALNPGGQGAGSRASPAAAAPAASLPEEAFPALPSGSGSALRPRVPPPPPPPPQYSTTQAFLLSGMAGGAATNTAATTAVAAQAPVPQLRAEDFPTLPAGPRPKSAQKVPRQGTARGTARQAQQQARPASASTPYQTPAAGSVPCPQTAGSPDVRSSGGPAVQGNPGSSSSLQAANRALIAKIQARLANEDGAFETFKAQSSAFLRAEVSAEAYHDHILHLGLQALVPELAALCPATDRREALMAAHRSYLATPAAQAPAPGDALGGWVPPEAAIAALDAAASQASWSCSRCTLVNAPSTAACEACGAPAPGLRSAGEAFPSLAAVYAPSGSRGPATTAANQPAQASQPPPLQDGAGDAAGGSGNKKKGKGGTKITIGLGAGAGGGAGGAGAGRAAPQGSSAWGGRGGAGPSTPRPPSGAWAASKGGGEKLARMHHALNDAWGEK